MELTGLAWVNLSNGFEFIEDSLLPVTVLLCLVRAQAYIPACLVWKQLGSVLATSRCLLLKVPKLCSVLTASLCSVLQVLLRAVAKLRRVVSRSNRCIATVASKFYRLVAAVLSNSCWCLATMVSKPGRRVATVVSNSYWCFATMVGSWYRGAVSSSRRAATLVARLYLGVASWIADVYHCTYTSVCFFEIRIAGCDGSPCASGAQVWTVPVG